MPAAERSGTGRLVVPFAAVAILLAASVVVAAEDCNACHGAGAGATMTPATLLAASVHRDLACTSCHPSRAEVPHPRGLVEQAGSTPCRSCHRDTAAEYSEHGWLAAPGAKGVPTCADCHGSHAILAASDPRSRTNPANLDVTCGRCHADVDLVRTYNLAGDEVTLYRHSVHGKHGRWGVPGASCVDCHGRGGSPHVILGAGSPDSPIFFFNIPSTCGRCHAKEEAAYEQGSHGRQVARGDTDAPVCTDCHGEHAITSPGSPASPVSARRVATETCAPCHRGVLAAGLRGSERGVVGSFFASYHGMRSMTGSARSATCVSCHDAHRVLPPEDPSSQVNPAHLQATCARCHPRIPPQLALMPIHDVGGRQGFRTPTARAVEWGYRSATTVLVILLAAVLLAELLRMLVERLRTASRRPDAGWSVPLRRFLVVGSFVVLAITGLALVSPDATWAHWLFGWPGGLALRRMLHRGAAAALTLGAIWHLAWVSVTRRGRRFLRSMIPAQSDLTGLAGWLGPRSHGVGGDATPEPGVTVVDKAVYWLVAVSLLVMIATGLVLWFDNEAVRLLSMAAVDVAWVVHLWQAWLIIVATVAWALLRRVRRLRRALQAPRDDS